MKAVIQRVKKTILSVENKIVSQIDSGYAVYLGIANGDTKEKAFLMAKKIANMRLLEDDNGKMNLSVLALNLEVLLISQFTLCADTGHGNRPSFTLAAPPDLAKELFDYTAKCLRDLNINLKTGVFGADMQISQHNDGPVTIVLEI